MPKAKGPADTLGIARLFYKAGLSKHAIAKKMGMDARTVAAALKRARDTGMVEIRIREAALNRSLEERLIEKYPHLLRVLTLPTLGPIRTAEEHAELVRRLGVLAAQYFEEFMGQQHGPVHLALSGGVSILETVNAIPEKLRPNLFIHVTALVGYGILDPKCGHAIPALNAGILWTKSGRLSGKHFSYATVTPWPPDLKVLAERPPIKAALEDMERVTFVLGGLGVMKSANTLRNQLSITGLLKPEDRRKISEAKAVADFSYIPVTREGNQAIDPETGEPLNFFLTGGYGKAHAGINFYKRLVKQRRPVLAIAGPFKTAAIRAALKGEFMNIWVTNEDTARETLEGS
ncbi:MAG: hypothetical protein ACRD22_13400 [Terriglobia bacterium]